MYWEVCDNSRTTVAQSSMLAPMIPSVVTSSVGSFYSAFGYTSEYTGDSTDLIYLRDRYYDPDMGRFLTGDSWKGNADQPMSYNLWNYVQSNPINYTDPTGHFGMGSNGCGLIGYFSPYYAAVNYVDKNVTLSKSDWLNTYTAAGIAVQCWAGTIQDLIVREADYSGLGPGQIANKWASTPYGEWIENPKYPGKESESRGYGLRCYMPIA